jgi:hypothetical protein
MQMNSREWTKFGVLVGAFALMGLTQGASGFFAFTGLGLVIWLVWRGRYL